MYDLIVVGGGPAAAAAAVYALGKQLDFLVIYEAIGKAGRIQQIAGQLDPEHLPGADAVRLFEKQVVGQAGRTLKDRVTEVAKVSGVFQVTTQHHRIKESLAVIIATGAAPIALGVPGASDLLGLGLGYSITTHAHLLAGKQIAVIGATIRALRGAAELTRTAAHVYLVTPRTDGSETSAVGALRHHAHVTVLDGYEVTEVVGTRNVEQVVVARDGQMRRLNVDAAFVDLGLAPNSEIVRGIVQTDAGGFIVVDDRNATTLPGLFAAGDVTTAFGEQILIAIGEGARAALSAYDYLLPHLPVYDLRPMD